MWGIIWGNFYYLHQLDVYSILIFSFNIFSGFIPSFTILKPLFTLTLQHEYSHSDIDLHAHGKLWPHSPDLTTCCPPLPSPLVFSLFHSASYFSSPGQVMWTPVQRTDRHTGWCPKEGHRWMSACALAESLLQSGYLRIFLAVQSQGWIGPEVRVRSHVWC